MNPDPSDPPRPVRPILAYTLIFVFVLDLVAFVLPARHQPGHSPATGNETLRALDERLEQAALARDVRLVLLAAVILGLALAGTALFVARWRAAAPIPEPADPPRLDGAPWGGASVAVLLGFYLGMMLLVAKSGLVARMSASWETGEAMVAILVQLAFNGLAASFALFLARAHGGSWAAMGLRFNAIRGDVGWALATYLGIVPITLLCIGTSQFLLRAIGYEASPNPAIPLLFQADLLEVGLIGFGVIVVAPLAEEILFRGFLYPAVRRQGGRMAARVVTALLFAWVHPLQDWLPIFALGYALAYLYERRGSILAPVTLHMVYNAGMLGIIFVFRSVAAAP